MAEPTLPVIDFGAFESGTDEARAHIADRIDHACRESGFFYLANHGIAADIFTDAFDAAALFFALPQADKQRIAIENSPCHRGWFALGGEALDACAHPEGDYKEGIKIGQDLAADHPRVRAGLALHGPNQWPDIEGWQPTMQRCFGACENLSRQLMQAFALALGLERQFFDAWLSLPMATLGPLYYPPVPPMPVRGDERARISAGAHTDFGCLTLLAQQHIGGLQILTRDNEWCDVPPRDDMLVVNIGDMLARWTNDRYASTRHRVVNKSNEARLSLAFFFDPDPDVDLSPLPGCVAPGAEPKYPPATSLSHLIDKIGESFSYRNETE
ncbi:MAG: isopenicillin N synthase family dioxygenase [Parvibaculales bacterium]